MQPVCGEDMLARLKRKEDKAYIQLFDLYYVRMFRFAESFVLDEEVAKDIVQQVFVSLYERMATLPDDTNVGGYLCVAVRNRSLNYLRDQDIEDQNKILYLRALNEAECMDWLEDEELITRIRSAISSLPEKYRRICELRFYHCQGYKEIATELSISENMAYVQVHRLIQKLRDSLKGDHEEALYLLLFFETFE